MNKILIIQTAFIGDVILATPLIEKLHRFFPTAEIDFMLRKGNEGLLQQHPFIHELLIWDKKQDKVKNLLTLTRKVRKNKYDLLVNIHRFASSGLVSFLSGAKIKTGFDKNPFSFCYDIRMK
jgi:ADP-heptose:LPS heptosyltransferase